MIAAFLMGIGLFRFSIRSSSSYSPLTRPGQVTNLLLVGRHLSSDHIVRSFSDGQIEKQAPIGG